MRFPMDARSRIVDSLIDLLAYRRECGAHTLELDAETLRALSAAADRAQSRESLAAALAEAERKTAAAATSAAAAPAAEDSPAECAGKLQAIAAEAAACRQCRLHEGRQRVVPGQGKVCRPDVLFVGEAPGAEEDRQGLAFVGRAGQLLTQMIAAMGYTRDEVFIANICKCRPPDNRAPSPDEMRACLPFLRRQIATLRPRAIVAMGNVAVLGLLQQNGIRRLRGRWTVFEGIPLMPTYHPAFLLRFPAAKREAWADLKKVLQKLGRPVPPVRRPAASGGQ